MFRKVELGIPVLRFSIKPSKEESHAKPTGNLSADELKLIAAIEFNQVASLRWFLRCVLISNCGCPN